MNLYKQRESIVSEQVNEKTYILLPQKGKMIELNQTASFIWHELIEAKKPNQIAQKLSNSFEVDSEMAAEDVRTTIDRFYELKLVTKVAP